VKLHSLSVTNLLGLESAEIVFDPGVVAIVGPNGSGKSSLLDALVVALFGEPSPVRVVKQSGLVRLGAEWGEVVLSFSVSKGIFRVTRKFRRNRSQEVLLERFDGASWEPLASTVQEAAGLLADLLAPRPFPARGDRLARLKDSFLASVFVPQGMVTRLIDSTPSERWSVLSSVLGLDDEERLRERARAVLDLAQAEEERLEGEKKALDERLSLLPVEEELSCRLQEAASAIALSEREVRGLRRAFDSRKELDRLESAASAAGLDLKASRSRLAEVRRLARLGEATEGLRRLLERARNVGERHRRVAALCREGEARIEKLAAKEALLRSLRREWREMEALLAAVEEPARLAEEGKALAEARAEEERLRRSLDEGRRELEALRSGLDRLERRWAFLRRKELQERRDRVLNRHREEAHRLASLVSGLSEALLAWLHLLADDDGLVRPERFRGARALKFAASLREAGLQDRLEGQARSRQRCLDLLREGYRIRKELVSLPSDLPDEAEPLSEAFDPAAFEREREQTVKALDTLGGTLQERQRQLEAVTRRRQARDEALGFPDDKELERFFAARRRREELLLLREDLRRRGEAMRDEAERLKMEATRLEAERVSARERLEEALSGLAEARREWREASRHHRWNVEELREALSLGEGTLPAGAFEAALAREEGSRRADENARRAVDSYRAALPSDPPPLQDLADRLDEAEEKMKEAWALRARLEEMHSERKGLERRFREAEGRSRELLPAADGARRLFRLTDGRSFPRFVGDYLMERLLQSVNGALPDKGWHLRARGGIIEVVEAEGVRPASSLSGGERSFIALLMLRRLASHVGFQEVLFIDEGLAMLDDRHLDRVIDLLGTLGREAFVAVITHDPDVAASFPRQWRLEEGRLSVEEERP